MKDLTWKALDELPWSRYPQPEWNKVDTVPQAIRALADGTNPDREYGLILYAVGNDHCGSYFPVVLPVIPFLGEILRGTALVARLRTLDVLLDLIRSFGPEPGYEEVESPSGPRPVHAMVREAVLSLTGEIERLRRDPESEEEGILAAELLEALKS
ncbi:MAG: hypothetical protein R3B48_17120 [Kofleriaceae bacterium]